MVETSHFDLNSKQTYTSMTFVGHSTNKIKIFCVSSLLILIGCMSTSDILTSVDDRAITTTIISKLVKDFDINHLKIKVITDEGEVFLIGRVDRWEQRIQAENHARSTGNVWSVINYLKVGKSPVGLEVTDDLAIELSLQERILKIGKSIFLNLTVVSYEADIFLIGRVPTNKIRENIFLVSRKMSVVQSIHKHIKAGDRK